MKKSDLKSNQLKIGQLYKKHFIVSHPSLELVMTKSYEVFIYIGSEPDSEQPITRHIGYSFASNKIFHFYNGQMFTIYPI